MKRRGLPAAGHAIGQKEALSRREKRRPTYGGWRLLQTILEAGELWNRKCGIGTSVNHAMMDDVLMDAMPPRVVHLVGAARCDRLRHLASRD
jgi:hypothetical protein